MMNGPDSDREKAEILIIRRGGGDDNAAHKGGAWKIAYADFVTAMMAFFLVMWLINSANEATRARVASYFNPIKMTDAQPTDKGLNDPNPNKKSSGSGGAASGDKASNEAPPKAENPAEQAKATAAKREEQLLQNPYKALEALSSEGAGNPTGRMVEVPSEKSGDPFDPKAWEALRQGQLTSEIADPAKPNSGAAADAGQAQALADAQGRVNATLETKPKEPGLAAERSKAATDVGGTKKALDGTDNAPEQGVAKQVAANDTQGKESEKQPKPAPTPADAKAQEAHNQQMVDAAREKIMQAAQRAGVAASLAISVKMTAEGMLISLADKTGDSMFEIGSAEPSPPLVALVGTIGTLLESEQGKIVVRGHTDARQYRNLKFDNWQLSTSRAHMASYMLMRGGLAEDRILKIEGYGSTSLINPDDPFAAENRRVEFLLKQ